jgi:hypothetical protein
MKRVVSSGIFAPASAATEPRHLCIKRGGDETPPQSDTNALANIGRVFRKVHIVKGGSS